jgi:Dolichyl-phosphate-mannose-protein mannosyltransferase
MGKAQMPESSATTRRSIMIFLLVWLLSAAYLGINLNKGWNQYDEGTLGQTAERILHGEMPHRDFHDPYTGGLAYTNAAIFKFFGINLFWLRLFLFVFFLAWVPAIYVLARQFLNPWPAAAVTLVAVAWSVPNYPAAMPSWFNLFFATFGVLALAKYIRRPAVPWLVLAGLCGGLSFLFKNVALYYLAAALLFFVYREQSLSRNESTPPRRTALYLAFLTLCLSIFIATLIKLVFVIGGTPEYLHFVFPGLAIALLLIFREHIPPVVSNWSRFRALFHMAAPFLIASAVPIILFFLFYRHHNGFGSLMNGLFVAPLLRVFYFQREPPGLVFEYPAVIATLLILETAKLRGQPRRVLSIFLVVLAALLLLTSQSQDVSYIVALQSAWGIIPVLAVTTVFVLSKKEQLQETGSENDQVLFLLFTITALFSLIQFPYAQVIYFCYGAPLAALLAACLLSRLPRPPRMILCATVVFYVLFPMLVIRTHYIGGRYHIDYASTPLRLPRVGPLRVAKVEATEFEELIPFVRDLAGQNPTFAGPDCPEVYFLAGIKNQTPILFDSLQDPLDYEREMRSLINRPNFLKVAVLHDRTISASYQLQILRSLVVPRFPNSRKIGTFTVYWRP